MKTVDKALALLGQFTTQTPEWGLSELARQTGTDKATTLRLMGSLVRGGLAEQDAASRRYRLGPGVLRLAHVREASAPVAALVRPVLERLSAATGETAHASIFTGQALVQAGTVEPQRPTRVHLDPAETLWLHATASGIACLSRADAATVAAALAPAGGLVRLTPATCTDPDALRARIAAARAAGHAVADQTYEDDVVGIAAAFLDAAGRPAGAIAVAAPAARAGGSARPAIAEAVMMAAAEITSRLGGTVPPCEDAAAMTARQEGTG
jgi:IclR family transcriptional regulator, acetate operon repressor